MECLPQREAAGGKLRVGVDHKRWENMPEERVVDEEEEAFRFLNRHDLASAFKGLYFPAVFVIRQGELFEVSSTCPSLRPSYPPRFGFLYHAAGLPDQSDHLRAVSVYQLCAPARLDVPLSLVIRSVVTGDSVGFGA